VVGVCWVVAGALVVLVAAWVFRLGEDLQLTWVVFAGLHLLLLAAWPILALGLVLRRSALAATAIGLIAVQLVVAWPVLARDRSDGGRATITVSSLNVFVDNPDPVATARRIAIDPPDVLVLQEYTPEARDEFERSHLLEYYPHRIDQAEPGTTGEAIYSRFPLRLGRPADGTRDQLAVVTTLPDGQDLHIADVHVFGPQGDDKAFWYRSLRTLDRDLTALPEPWIAIGDYNATTDHRAYRDLLDGGRADAHVATGRGHARTWPAGKAVPPVFLIDHAIVSPGVEVTGTREQTLPGTDHRMIEVDLRVADE
jgi:endonuclease/exonuclease/phosphatase (EEP) superfamily protein YafD